MSNTGDAAVNNIVMVDEVVEGLEFVEGSIIEIEGGSFGVAQYKDGSVEWTGTLNAGTTVVVHFQTRVNSSAEFAACNFADGNANDATCTNHARITFNSSSTSIDEDSAGLTTSLATVLAYTGSRNYVSLLVGIMITVVAFVLTAGVYFSRGGNGFGGFGGGGDVPQEAMVSVPSPHVVHPQK